MSHAERFEDLRIWQQARGMVRTVNHTTREMKDFGFRNQARSAALSVMNNIAEGFERRTDADFAHFLDIAKASSGEVRSMTYVAEDESYLSSEAARGLRDECIQLSCGIATLAAYLRKQK